VFDVGDDHRPGAGSPAGRPGGRITAVGDDGTRRLDRSAYEPVLVEGFAYPLQLMIDLFEFTAGPDREPSAYPKTGEVGAVRGYRSR
jgi:hypothetical protein